MLTLGLISFVSSVLFYVFVDAPLCAYVIPEEQLPVYWVPISLIMFLFTYGMTLGPLLWNFQNKNRQDYIGVILLLATPLILVSSGILDVISASMIEYLNRREPLNWLNYKNWWWMDPYPINGLPIPWSIPWCVSVILGHAHTLTTDMLIGSTIGLSTLVLLWVMYARS